LEKKIGDFHGFSWIFMDFLGFLEVLTVGEIDSDGLSRYP
jgi:hypothetical protein